MRRACSYLSPPPCAAPNLYAVSTCSRARWRHWRGERLAEGEAARAREVKAEPLVEAVGAGILLLGVQHNLPGALALEVVDRLSHQPRADARAPRARMGGDTHEVADLHIDDVELVADDALLVFGYHEVGIEAGSLAEGACVVAPEVVEAERLQRRQRLGVIGAEWPHYDALIALCRHAEVALVVAAQHAGQRETHVLQRRAQPVVVVVGAGV